MMTRNGRCPNFNHGRSNAPVRCCPMCGELVNSMIPQKVCSEEKHAKSRRERNAYCVDCGAQLTQGK
jgi:rRNA maturation protein Nop10